VDPSKPVEVACFIDVRQAEFARSVLEGSGITAFIDQPFTGTIAPHYMLGSGGVRLFVAAEFKERAQEVLDSLPEASAEALDDVP
jgi:hypothetical protein